MLEFNIQIDSLCF